MAEKRYEITQLVYKEILRKILISFNLKGNTEMKANDMLD